MSARAYEWTEGRGKPPRRVELPDLEPRPKFPAIPIGSEMSRAHQNYLDNKRKELEAQLKAKSKNKGRK